MKGFEPVHRQVAVHGLLHIADELQHLVQAIAVKTEQPGVKPELQEAVEGNCRKHQHDIGQHAEDAERNHGPHGVGGDHEDRGGQAAGGSDVFG